MFAKKGSTAHLQKSPRSSDQKDIEAIKHEAMLQ
jgi:hypothetical protein